MLNDTGEQDQDNVIPTEKTTTNVDKSSISNYERQTGRQRERQILTFGSTDIQERHIVRPRSCASRSSPTTTRSPLNDKKSSGQKTQGPRGMLPGIMRLKEKKIDNQRRSMITWMSLAVAKPRDQAPQIQPDPLLLAAQDPKNCKQNEWEVGWRPPNHWTGESCWRHKGCSECYECAWKGNHWRWHHWIVMLAWRPWGGLRTHPCILTYSVI